MPYDEKLADRIREIISKTHRITEEKKMFGGLCFMVDHKMCVGIQIDHMMIRFDPSKYEQILENEDCRPMEFTGKPMRGYVYVDPEFLTTQKKLNFWIQLALEYNATAKESKKKK